MSRAAVVSLLLAACAAGEPLKMKFNEVREVAPGVFFRYSSISPTDPSIFGGSNNIWVVFDEYVVVIDANFPKEAGDVIEAIRKTTKKPIRYVLDTHHHGDHAWGNDVWIKAGATVVASRKAAKLLRDTGPEDFAKAGKGKGARKDVAEGKLGFPSLIFDEKLVLDDGTQRVEFLQLGHSHTMGDAVAYLPRHKILCTGDACVNGPYNFMGHSDSASWIRCLERMEALDVKLVLPGHGVPMGKELLANQKRYFVELRRQVKKAIDEGKDADDTVRSIDMPWYKAWTTVRPDAANVKHVYGEYTGLVAPWELEHSLGILAGPSPTKDTPDWVKPTRMVVPASLTAEELTQLRRAAPFIEFLPVRTPEQAARLAADADGVLGYATAEVLKAGKRLRWVQATPEGIDEAAWKAKGKVTITDTRRINAPAVAEQSMALLLSMARKAGGSSELTGKRLLLVGLDGTGEQIAKRAAAFGLRITALGDAAERPEGVERVEKLSKLDELLPSADIVVLALPLTVKTREVIGAKQVVAMKKGAWLINAAHDELVVKGAAHRDGITYAGGPGDARPTEATRERLWLLYRENVRRFAAGEPLLGVVE